MMTLTVKLIYDLIEHIRDEMEMNPKFEAIKTVLMKSYDGLPYYLKSCFLYLSIFPEDRNVSRRRLVCRWIVEGYSRDRAVANRYFMELVERSMILPTQQSVCSIQGFNSCQLHDLIRDISIAKSMEENLVFRLEEGCSLHAHGAVRHLAISSNWEGDESELESTVELSRIRSLTVFGKWRPFYISAKMRFLRVLDLESTFGLANRNLEQIGKLLHLRYLSLRGCYEISYLPDYVGNLRQLETLDIKHTQITVLPKTIINLRKLHCLQAGKQIFGIKMSTIICCVTCREKGAAYFGVKVPGGIGKMKTLHTLRHVNLAWGNAAVQEIKGLTGLRKLGVFGINTKNGPQFCSVISSLSRLETLSVQSGEADLYDCLCGMSSPPESLQSLKLVGHMKKLPEWIKGLQNLVKLNLCRIRLLGDGEIMQVIGNLPNLSILRFLNLPDITEPISITFQSGLFRSLVVLHLVCYGMKIESVEFERTSMPKLEVFSLELFHSAIGISGLEFLPSIKEVHLDVEFFLLDIQYHESMTEEEERNEARRREDKLKEDIGKQLASNKNRPILKLRNY